MKKLKTILLVLAIVLLPITVNAKLFDSVNKGKITGEENGFRFNVGQTVEQEITNDGLTFLAGQDIKSKSTLKPFILKLSTKLIINGRCSSETAKA